MEDTTVWAVRLCPWRTPRYEVGSHAHGGHQVVGYEAVTMEDTMVLGGGHTHGGHRPRWYRVGSHAHTKLWAVRLCPWSTRWYRVGVMPVEDTAVWVVRLCPWRTPWYRVGAMPVEDTKVRDPSGGGAGGPWHPGAAAARCLPRR